MDLKRPNDDFLGTDAKRSRSEAVPSKVLYFRNLSIDTTETDLTQFCASFGRVANVLKLKEKNQAFVELDSVTTAATLLNFFAAGANQPVIRNQPVDIQYSSRQQVTVDSKTAYQGQGGEELSGTILHITIANMSHPVDCDVLYHIFSQYGGTILRIVCFEKNGVQQGLIEYSEPNGALVAKSVLNHHNIYNDGCTLKIDYSRLPRVNVRPDDKNARDFTTQAGYGGHMAPVVGGAPAIKAQVPGARISQPMMPSVSRGGSLPGAAASSKVLLVNNLNQEKVTPHVLFKLFGTCGDVIRVKVLYHKRDMAFLQFRDATHAMQALTHLKDAVLFDQKINLQVSKMKDVPLPPPHTAESYEGLTTDYSNSTMHRFAMAGSKNANNITFPNQSLHISNISDGIEQEQIIQLFSMYGQVEIFRFFNNNKKMGVIRFANAAQAIIALVGLHGESLEQYGLPPGDGRGLVISFSKSIDLPRA